MGRPQLLPATAGRESVPVGAESRVCSQEGEEKREGRRISDVSDVLLRGRLCSVLGKRVSLIRISQADASASSKQSVQKAGGGGWMSWLLKGDIEGGLFN